MPTPIVAGTMHAKDMTRGSSSSKQRKESVPRQHLPRKGKKQQPERREMEGRERERERVEQEEHRGETMGQYLC